MNLNWLRNRNWLKKPEAPGGDVPVGPPASFGNHPLKPKRKARPYVIASKATRRQARRYQDRSIYLGLVWECQMCNYNNEGVICTHCGYVPENSKLPVPMGGLTVLSKIRNAFKHE